MSHFFQSLVCCFKTSQRENFGSLFWRLQKALFVLYVQLQLGASDEARGSGSTSKRVKCGRFNFAFLVLVEQRKPDRCQLCVKGDYDRLRIADFLQKRALIFEEDTKKGLCIFKP